MKKQIENIFSEETKKEKLEQIPNPNLPIIVDTREKQSLIAASLRERKANMKFEKLEIGDYLIGEVIIERKTFSDFISSMINKRLLNQLAEMKKYPKQILLVEGFYYNYKESRIHENAIRGMFLTSILSFNIPILFTENENDTASFLISIAKKQEKQKTISSLRQSKSSLSTEEQKQFILEGFPGIGPVTAKELLKKYSSLLKIFNTPRQNLKQENITHEKNIDNFKNLLEDGLK